MSARDRSKLPKWAQDEMDQLERDKRDLKERLTEAHKAAGFREEEYFRITPLNPQAYIRLWVGHPHPARKAGGDVAAVDVHSDGEHVTISSPDGGLVIFPKVTNSVQVSVTR